MQKALASVLLRQVLPMIIGAVGAWALTEHPSVHAAFCGAL